MLDVINQALAAGRFLRSPVALDKEPENAAGEVLLGHSQSLQEVYKTVGRVAATETTVLIQGESSTDNKLAARAIYHHSHRRAKPFFVIKCVAIPETLLESELFGYEREAFTGATHRRVAKIEQAHEGTGFGLFIADKIVKQHNGNISVKSKPGRGTRFTV